MVGFWVVLELGDIGHAISYAEARLINTPQSWRPPLPYGRLGAFPLAQLQQQLANMLRNKSMSLKLENIIVFTIYLLAFLKYDQLLTHHA